MSNTRAWKYVVPNLVTCLGLLFGLLSIAASFSGNGPAAGWFIIMGVLVDKLDGTLARRLDASSAFGEQMDSLADLVTFGVAPAMMFLGYLHGNSAISADAPGWFGVYAHSCVFLFATSGALRLARFNVMSAKYGHEYFFGTPVPMSGALLATLLMIFTKYDVEPTLYRWIPALYAVMALMMVSRVPIPKLKKLKNPALNLFLILNVTAVYLMGFTWFVVPESWHVPEYLLACIVVYFSVGSLSAFLSGVRAPR